ncbi:MAG: 3-phosphoshikimate 1-carboxyvinyltransferase [Pelagibacteraceae bacterium]|jgi:3-phosphoshikimate 1-carboxyvinyltransferase|nr:3-phosphoshikimate 1-carboxyvinyltransferase [Pelagibacteraceae bacterium]MCI5079630.1 3-phosphoshikimate 1-carboxyvinyltransferase [Pelagibacteraceae bacterium]
MAIKKSIILVPENNINIKGSVELSSDKSLSIRSVIFSSIGYGISTVSIKNPGEDAQTAIQAIKTLGIRVVKKKDQYIIYGLGIGYNNKKILKISFNNSGTTLRLLTPLIAGSKMNAIITGDKSLSKRPYRLEFLKQFLMNLRPTRKKYLPIQIKGHGNCIQSNIKITKPSAQMVSAATIAGIISYGETVIEAPNNVRDHTTRILKYLNYPIKIQNKKNKQIIKIQGRQFLRPIQNYNIPSDPSSSAFLIAIAILTKDSVIKIKNVCLNPYRIGFIKVLKRMGAKISFSNKKNYFGEPVGDITASYSQNLKGITINPNEVASIIDEIPILLIVALFCKSKSIFNNLTELKFKESDRLRVMHENLILCGANITKVKDNLIINGINNRFYSSKVPVIKDYSKDHRICMAFFCLAAVSRKKIQINDFDSVNVSFPNFLKTINDLKYNKDKKILVAADGPVACGKTSILKKLVKKFGSKRAAFLDSGLLYRHLTLVHLQSKKKKINANYLVKHLKKVSIAKLQNPRLHSIAVSNKVSEIAKIKIIRQQLLPVQRDLIFNCPQQIVLVGGRDIASTVIPNNFSDIKLYINCDVKVRAKRRYLELKNKKNEKNVNYNEILKALKARDLADSTRAISPLKKTKDSILIDNSFNDISRPINKISLLIEREIKKH